MSCESVYQTTTSDGVEVFVTMMGKSSRIVLPGGNTLRTTPSAAAVAYRAIPKMKALELGRMPSFVAGYVERYRPDGLLARTHVAGWRFISQVELFHPPYLAGTVINASDIHGISPVPTIDAGNFQASSTLPPL